MRRHPFEQERFSESRLDEALQRAAADADPSREQGPESDARGPEADPSGSEGGGTGSLREEMAAPFETHAGDPRALPRLLAERDRGARGDAGRRSLAAAGEADGRPIRTVAADGNRTGIAVAATVRAAAVRTARAGDRDPHQEAVVVRPEDARTRLRERVVGATIIFLVDLSGSMRAKRRLEAARGAALALLTEAYQRRDRVALIAFRGRGAEVVLPPTSSVEVVQQRLGELPVGGRTPLTAGLRAGLELVRQVRLKDRGAICVPVLLSDGKANAAADGESPVESALEAARGYQQPRVHPLVLDTEDGGVRLGLAARVAEQAGARYVHLADLSAGSVAREARAVALAASD